MPDAIILSSETYGKLKKFLDDYDNGLEKTLQLGEGLKFLERGTGYVKIGLSNVGSNAANGSGITVSDGTTTLTGVRRMNYLGTLFGVSSGGVGIANITLHTENCSN